MLKLRSPLGFTFVEIVVALGMFIVGIWGVFGLYSASHRLSAHSLSRDQASAACREILEVWRAAGPSALAEVAKKPASAGGAVLYPADPEPLPGATEMTWQASLEPIEGQPKVVKVTVGVAWGAGRGAPLTSPPGASFQSVEWLPIQ